MSATTENTSKVKLELPDDLKQAILEIVKDAAVQVVGSATRRDEQTWPEYMNKQQAAKLDRRWRYTVCRCWQNGAIESPLA